MIIIVKFGFPVFKVLVKHFLISEKKEKRTFMFIFRQVVSHWLMSSFLYFSFLLLINMVSYICGK